MAIYKVRWRIELETGVIGVDSEEQAVQAIENCDCVEDGDYVEGSFEILKVEQVGYSDIKGSKREVTGMSGKITRFVTTAYEEEIPKKLEDFRSWEFSSGSTTGEDFKIFSRLFRKWLTKEIPLGSELLKFNAGHYYLSGFIGKADKYTYFSTSDVRHFPGNWYQNILIRTAKSDTDYTGGSNCHTTLENFQKNITGLLERP